MPNGLLRSVLVLGCLAAPLCAFAGEWAKDPTTGCLLWHGKPNPPAELTMRWSGPCPNGRASGVGTWELTAAGKFLARYDGTMKDGRPEGLGIFRDASGQSYQGEFRNGRMDGQGKLTAEGGVVYEGAFKDGTMHGQGTLIQPDGTRLTGRFERGMPIGRLVPD